MWLRLALLLPVGVGIAAGWFLLAKHSALVAACLAALWLSRVLPFAILKDELRYLVVLVPVYSVCLAVAADWLLTELNERRRAGTSTDSGVSIAPRQHTHQG